jgi:drug/metabolite transporter (DMT)-like permease
LIQILVFNELPSNITWIGVGLVMCAILIIGGKKIWKSKSKSKQKKKVSNEGENPA